MSVLEHERPGVYSTYDASAVVSAGQATKVIGVAAKAAKGTEKEPVTVTGYTAGVEAFGEDAETPGMSTILRLLFANGASTVVAVRVAENGELADYQAAFAALADQDVQILVCDSADVTVQQALRTAVEEASETLEEDQWSGILEADDGFYLLLRRPLDTGAVAADYFDSRLQQAAQEADITTTSTFDALEVPAFYERLTAARDRAEEDGET